MRRPRSHVKGSVLRTILRCNLQLPRTCLVAADGLSSVFSILAFQHLGFRIISLLQIQRPVRIQHNPMQQTRATRLTPCKHADPS